MKINRLLETTVLLMARDTVTARELAERFEVSARTVYRDIEILSAAGVPVYTKKGKSGGISLMEEYTLNKALFTENESEGLLLALKAMRATNYPEADAILNKLSSIFKGSKAHDWIEVDFERWNSTVNERDRFSKIRYAIINGQVIGFDYVNAAGEKSSRFAEPVKLIFNAYTWYLIAYCLLRNSFRMFRLSRIKNVTVTDQKFAGREIPEHETSITYAPLIVLKLRCNENAVMRLYDNFDEQYINRNGDGSYDLTVEMPEDEWVYSFILSFGGAAAVLEPEHIREIIKTRAKEILEKY